MIDRVRFHHNQIKTLLYRSLLGFVRNKSDVRITMLQAPILAIAFYIVFAQTGGFFDNDTHLFSLEESQTVLFLSVLSAVWFGTSKAMLEIPSYWRLYIQERISFLRDTHFIIARFSFLCIVATIQCILFATLFHLLFVVLPMINAPLSSGLVSGPDVGVDLLSVLRLDAFSVIVFSMTLVSLASVATALAISSFMSTPAAASAFLPFYLILQILLSGSVIKPAVEMNSAVYYAASITSSRWGYELFTIELKQVLVDSVASETENRAFAESGLSLTEGLINDLLYFDYSSFKAPIDAEFSRLLEDPLTKSTALRAITSHLSHKLENRPDSEPHRLVLSSLEDDDIIRASQLMEQFDKEEKSYLTRNISSSFRDSVFRLVDDVNKGISLSDERLYLWKDFVRTTEGKPLLFTHYHLWTCYSAIVLIVLISLSITKFGLVATSRRLSEAL